MPLHACHTDPLLASGGGRSPAQHLNVLPGLYMSRVASKDLQQHALGRGMVTVFAQQHVTASD